MPQNLFDHFPLRSLDKGTTFIVPPHLAHKSGSTSYTRLMSIAQVWLARAGAVGPRQGVWYNGSMNTAEAIYERAKTLPDDLQAEALHYLDYLMLRRQMESEDREWAQFATSQLANQYAADDAIYDKE
jgi:hypothetical protein